MNKPIPSNNPIQELKELEFEIVFETTLARIVEGETLRDILSKNTRNINQYEFMKWIDSDKQRKTRFEEAYAFKSEFMVSDLLESIDRADNKNDIARAKLQLQTYQYLMGSWNKKYQTSKDKDNVTVNINLLEAINNGRERLDAIDI